MSQPTPHEVQQVDYLRDEVRELEARLDATPPGAPGRQDLMVELSAKRGIWRRAEVIIGRRAAGFHVGHKTIPYKVLEPVIREINDLKDLAKRNTGKRVS